MRSEGFWVAPHHLSCHNESHSQDILMWLTTNGGLKAQIPSLFMVGKGSTTKSTSFYFSDSEAKSPEFEALKWAYQLVTLMKFEVLLVLEYS